ncbi:Release factor glutamine methyltransferase [Tetrabaena socialis]|uniref:Release factor glutamine methyltransferase n=1 Tax=Tetrabaena socialis TaxID=47790 RepID=A0A2J8A3F1_9CHLO|nr:Release factor glutamine methyltransferase [Tetrabaena socialis]|eukprot:PNH07052.1 Release factor glutamine methyltransferase [Tetrabaena socialis]
MGAAATPPLPLRSSPSTASPSAAAAAAEPGQTPIPGGPLPTSPSLPSSSSASAASSAASAASAAPADPAPQLPLCLRPPTHIEPLPAVLAWRAAMEERVADVGDDWEERDGGPGREGLLRELDWVLDDVVESAQVWAVDLSPTAAAYAAFNADLVFGHPAHVPSGGPPAPGAAARTATPAAAAPAATATSAAVRPAAVRVVQGSWFEPLLAAGLAGRLGGLLSNPPYIPRAQMAGLQAEVGGHEPCGALDGGEGAGLDSLAVLAGGAAGMLVAGGLVAFETAGGEQAEQVAELLRAARLPGADAGSGAGEECGAGVGAAATAEADGAAGTRAGRGMGVGQDTGTGAAAFEGVEVVEDCYGVRRFVRAYRTGA